MNENSSGSENFLFFIEIEIDRLIIVFVMMIDVLILYFDFVCAVREEAILISF